VDLGGPANRNQTAISPPEVSTDSEPPKPAVKVYHLALSNPGRVPLERECAAGEGISRRSRHAHGMLTSIEVVQSW
jgi:hypothetical protein